MNDYNVDVMIADILGNVTVLKDLVYSYWITDELIIAQCLVAACEGDLNMLILLYERYIVNKIDKLFSNLLYHIVAAGCDSYQALIVIWGSTKDIDLSQPMTFDLRDKTPLSDELGNPNSGYRYVLGRHKNEEQYHFSTAPSIYHLYRITPEGNKYHQAYRNRCREVCSTRTSGIPTTSELCATLLMKHLISDINVIYCVKCREYHERVNQRCRM